MKQLIFLSAFIFVHVFITGQVPDSGYISLGSDSIFYESRGSGNTIMMIHDGLLHREVWDDQYAYFAKSYQVIRYDRRGYGKSSPATDSYTHLEDLETLFERLKIDSAILFAGSSGGALAIDFTLKNPQKVEGLVLFGAVVGGLPYTSHLYNRGGHLPDSFANEMEEAMYYIHEDPYEIYFKNTGVKEKAARLYSEYPQRIYSRQKFVRPDIPAYMRLNEIKVPALILVGEFDHPDVHAHAGAINAGIRNSKRIIIPGSGHLIPMEQPELFNEITTEFIQQDLEL